MVNNKRIAKNTFLLFFRMLFLMAISLYTSRIVLHNLGINDFGIYNIVGSIVILFSFITNALNSATRRFLNYNIGIGNESELKKIFSSLITVHFIIAFLIFILCETIGVWVLNTQLNIPENRLFAANIVFQFCILTTFIGIQLSPYEGTILAEEKMSFYAYISLCEAIFKLLLVVSLTYSPFDRLITYASVLFMLSCSINVFKLMFCRRNFYYCTHSFIRDKTYIRPLLTFSGWSLFGQLAFIGSTTGVNMIINVFLGVTVNTALGIAQQVNIAVYHFVLNFQTAFNPQLIKSYASRNIKENALLLSRTSRGSFFLLFIIAIPLLFNIDYLLHLWLIEVPSYTASFTKILIICTIIEAIAAPLWMVMQATGNIKKYEIIVSCINFLNIPLTFIILSMDYSPVYVFIVQLLLIAILYVFRIGYVLTRINLPKKQYIFDVLLPIILISTITTSCVYIGFEKVEENLTRLISSSIVSTIITTLLFIFIGLSSDERKFIQRYFIKFYNYLR